MIEIFDILSLRFLLDLPPSDDVVQRVLLAVVIFLELNFQSEILITTCDILIIFERVLNVIHFCDIRAIVKFISQVIKITRLFRCQILS